MARTLIANNKLPGFGGKLDDLTFTAADSANGMYLVNTGRVFLYIDNVDVATRTATIPAVDDQYQRGLGTEDEVIAVAAGDRAIAGPFLPSIWNQPGSNQLHVDWDAAGANCAAIEFTPSA